MRQNDEQVGEEEKGECDVSEAKRRKTFSKDEVINHIRISSSWQVTYMHFHWEVHIFVLDQQVSHSWSSQLRLTSQSSFVRSILYLSCAWKESLLSSVGVRS